MDFLNILYSFGLDYAIVSIFFLITSYLIWKKDIILIVGFTKKNKNFMKVKNKIKVKKDLAILFFSCGIISLIFFLVICFDDNFRETLNFISKILLIALAFFMFKIQNKVRNNLY